MLTVVQWCKQYCPKPKQEGVFYPYAVVQETMFGYVGDNPGKEVREEFELKLSALLKEGIAVQLGVQSHGRRGIRLFSIK